MDLLRKMTKKTVPKKHSGMTNKNKKKKKNSRKPRDRQNKHSKRKKVSIFKIFLLGEVLYNVQREHTVRPTSFGVRRFKLLRIVRLGIK